MRRRRERSRSLARDVGRAEASGGDVARAAGEAQSEREAGVWLSYERFLLHGRLSIWTILMCIFCLEGERTTLFAEGLYFRDASIRLLADTIPIPMLLLKYRRYRYRYRYA
ncbi:hypothetical protein EVAR_53404_1 [Eumeta japonica]|uniref:Uncharacterized protein n=1 Tax=Eumeta variegata TaxID=151549 RepID=A0A4C1XQW7_EUMVA|nr:hypothetical protein EVAR_53404_1 [Eumeta japonica]